MMSITISKIAEVSGYSEGAISLALREDPRIPQETREKIFTVCRNLNYSPNIIAKALTTKKTNTIGLIVPYVWNPLFGELVHHIEVYARLKSFNVVLAVTEGNIEMERDALRVLKSRQVDAILICTNYEDGREGLFLEFEKSNIPFVLMGFSASANINYVAVDREVGVYIAVEHLINLGHKRIASVGLTMKHHDHKFIGYKKALENERLKIREDFIITCESSFKMGYDSAKKILKLTPCPSAVFCASDVIAIGLIKGFKEMGVRVPEDIAIVSFDDIEEAAYAEVPLTTIHHPRKEIAESVINIALENLICEQETGEELPPRQNLIKPKLVIRASCGMKLQQVQNSTKELQ